MKKTVLIPTDFSANALMAARTAALMASLYKWRLHLIHVYSPLNSPFAGQDFNELATNHAEGQALLDMKKLVGYLYEEYPDLEIESRCVAGVFSDVLVSLAGESTNQLIVMGTNGASGLKHVTLGSNTFEIIKKSPIPVLAVPEGSLPTKFESLGLLSNFKESEIQALNTVTDLLGKALNVTVLHVHEQSDSFDEHQIRKWSDTLMRQAGVADIRYEIESTSKRLDVHETLPHCIDHLVEVARIDALLINYTPKSFFRELFSRSLTKAIAHQLKVPAFFCKV